MKTLECHFGEKQLWSLKELPRFEPIIQAAVSYEPDQAFECLEQCTQFNFVFV